jgi:hypothetical protein
VVVMAVAGLVEAGELRAGVYVCAHTHVLMNMHSLNPLCSSCAVDMVYGL